MGIERGIYPHFNIYYIYELLVPSKHDRNLPKNSVTSVMAHKMNQKIKCNAYIVLH